MSATKTSQPSTKYNGWTGHTETSATGNKTYFLTMDSGGYAVGIIKGKGVWYGELMTRQTWGGRSSWETAKHNPFEGTVAEVVAEAERRAAYHASKKVA